MSCRMTSSSSTTNTRPSPCVTGVRLPGNPHSRSHTHHVSADTYDWYPCSGPAGDTSAGSAPAPIAQGIEQRPPEPCAQVRILLGAPPDYHRQLAAELARYTKNGLVSVQLSPARSHSFAVFARDLRESFPGDQPSAGAWSSSSRPPRSA